MARAKNPGSLVYINRPRSKGLGYFLHYELDPEKGASAAPLFDLDFYFMEAMNGAIFGGPNRESVEDWFHLLNWGCLVRIVGTPHAHGIAGGEPGYSRTYVLYDADDTRDLDQSALFQAMK